MDFPENTLLPLFSYGIFRPGEIAYLRLKPYVARVERNCPCSGRLLIRDGLVLLDPEHNGMIPVTGDLLYFVPEKAGAAYYSIVELEPGKQYQWQTIDIAAPSGLQRSNVLIGINLPNGSFELDRVFSGKDDPLFRESFQITEKVLSDNSESHSKSEPNPDFTNFLYLQMAYMLLWSSIERYATLRYGLGDNVMAKILMIAADPAFADALRSSVSRRDAIFSTSDPSTAIKLNKDNPRNSLKYYYQVRCNITHRGKAAFDDFDRLLLSLKELSRIFKRTLQNAFEESEG